MNNEGGCYAGGFAITFFLVFIGTWIYCIAAYGFLLGVGLGWLPAAICGMLAGLLWPLLWLAVAGVIGLIWYHS
jgi:hypothetical protein